MPLGEQLCRRLLYWVEMGSAGAAARCGIRDTRKLFADSYLEADAFEGFGRSLIVNTSNHFREEMFIPKWYLFILLNHMRILPVHLKPLLKPCNYWY